MHSLLPTFRYQVGASLSVRTRQRLKAEGVICDVIDPQSRGTSPTKEKWHRVTIKRRIEDLGLIETINDG